MDRLRELHVAVVAGDPLRAAELRAWIAAAGHAVVDETALADIVLADGSAPITNKPAVVLGSSTAAQGSLATHATARQIDIALRAVASGLIVRMPVRDGAFGLASIVDVAPDDLLTPRELQMLGSIASGLSNKAIAARLAISQHTVKFHVQSMFRKLGVRSRAEAVGRSAAWLNDHRLDL